MPHSPGASDSTAVPPLTPNASILVAPKLLTHARVPMRHPTELELHHRPEFSKCTVPVVVYQTWLDNLMETFARTAAYLHRYQQQLRHLDERISLVLATAWKLPLEPWAAQLLQPFTRYAPTTLHHLSNAWPPGTPSASTAEGVALRCFARVVVARFRQGAFQHMAPAAQHIARHYEARGLPQVALWPASTNVNADALDGSGVAPAMGPRAPLRVLVEVRASGDSRQFMQLDAFLHECNEAGLVSPVDGRPVALSCVAHTFGLHGLAHDIAVARQADVLVALHGAGETNALFMRQGASLLEVRPCEFGSTWAHWPNGYFPALCHFSGFRFFWWGLNVEEAALCAPGSLEAAGLADKAFAARDRHVRLRWRDVQLVFRAMLRANGQAYEYAQLVRSQSYLWQVGRDGRLTVMADTDAVRPLIIPRPAANTTSAAPGP